MKSKKRFVLLLWLSVSLSSCTSFQTSDFAIGIRLPASRKCYQVNVMSGKETESSPEECDKIISRGIFMTSESWKLLRGDIQTNCQYAQCTQISGAADGLFMAVDKALKNVPF